MKRAMGTWMGVAMGAAGGLWGCVDQAKVVALYRKVLEGQAPAATRPAGAEIARGQVLTLAGAMGMAARDNERLAIGGEEYVQALIDKERAVSVFLPTIALAPTFQAMEQFDHVRTPLFPQHTVDVPVTLQANVHGVRDWSNVRGAALTAEQRRELLLDLQATLLLETARIYYGVLRSEQAVRVLEQSLSLQERHVQDVSDKLAQGVVRRLDLEQARARAAGTRVQLTDARHAVVVGRSTLAFLLGVARVDGDQEDAFAVPGEVEGVDAWMATAEERRRDLRGAERAQRAAREGVNAAVGQYYPSVGVNLNAFLTRETIPDDSSFTALLGVNVPLFTAGRIHADVRTAWSRYRQSALAAQMLRREVREQVEQAYAALGASGQRVSDLETEVTAAEEAQRIAAESYAAGVVTSLDVLDAQDRLLTAQLELSGGRYQRIVNFLALERAAGTLEGSSAGRADGGRAQQGAGG
jgi:outer membrane protein TolC